jgi:WhiB family redox-sensing transcriptional regulator
MSQKSRLNKTISIPLFVLKDDPACAQTDPEIFFPMDIEMGFGQFTTKYQSLEAAKKVCQNCPLINECLEYAIENYEIGVWGGTTERERYLMRRRNRRKYPAKHRGPSIR